MFDGTALRSDSATAATIAAFAKCLSSPSALSKLNTAFGEDMFGNWLVEESARRGLNCEDFRKKGLAHDFVINGYRVQCKCGAGKKSRIDCTPVRPYAANPTVRRYPICLVDVMAICFLDSFEVFIVPTSEFTCPKHDGMVRGSFLKSKFCQWKDAWHVIDGTPGKHPSQLQLFV
jgi:hypothetical protein